MTVQSRTQMPYARMPQADVDVSASRGSARPTRSTSERVANFVLTEWVHGVGHSMERHSHDMGCIALTLDGGMTEKYDSMSVERPKGTLLYRPPAEPHSCMTGNRGARCFVIEFDASMLPSQPSARERLNRPV